MKTSSLATAILEGWGFSVSPIETGQLEQSDLLVTAGDTRLLIEEKTKLDDPKEEERRRATLARGDIHLESIPVKPSNRLSGVVRKAVAQLTSSSESIPHDFRLIWFTALGINAEPKFNRFAATLYGYTNIIEMHSTGFRRCYFFRNSEFFRHRETLDGAVVAAESGDSFTLQLCLNPLSPRFVALRSCAFAARFESGVLDPTVAEGSGSAYIADTEADRADEAEVLAYLQTKYQTRPLMTFDVGHMSATVSIPRNAI
jgi:hypothetical protein